MDGFSIRRLRRAVSGLTAVAVMAVGVSVGAIVVSSDANAAACGTHTAWTTFGFDNARSGVNPCEKTLSRSTVPHLRLLWTATLSSVSVAQPTYAPGIVVNGVARNLVFVADEHGYVRALDAGTGAVVWVRSFGVHQSTCTDMPDMKFGVSAAPVLNIATHTGYLVGGNDDLYAIDLATGATKPGWNPVPVGTATVDHVYGALTLGVGVVYATTASYCDFGTYYGKVVAVSTVTGKVTTIWKVVNPVTHPGQYGGGIWGPGGVSIDAATGTVYTTTGNGMPSEHVGYGEQVVQLTPTLQVQAANYAGFTGTDVDYGATPLLFQPPGCPAMLAAKNKSGVLAIYDRNTIAHGPVQKIQMANPSDDNFNGIPSYSAAENMVYVSNSSHTDSLSYDKGLVGFKVLANCTLAPAWRQAFGDNQQSVSPPTVANGVVYEGDGPDNTLWAFNSTTGAHLWDSGSTITGMIFAAPTVVDGHLYTAAWNHKIYAYGT